MGLSAPSTPISRPRDLRRKNRDNKFETILYEQPIAHVAKITLNRPETRNAQNTQLLYELNDAFDVAACDDAIKVIILAGNGPHFFGRT